MNKQRTQRTPPPGMRTVSKAYRLKLYPSAAQRTVFAKSTGSCRWLWNRLLALQTERYEAESKFVFRFEMQAMLPGLKQEFPWLMETPAHSLQRVCRNLDQALKRSFKSAGATRAGFPKFKIKNKSRESFYVSNNVLRVDPEDRSVTLPKAGSMRFRAGRLPEGRILGATVFYQSGDWWCTVQCEVDIPIVTLVVTEAEVVGVDLGLKDLAVVSDGRRIEAPKHLSKAEKRMRRAQRKVARRSRGSANRRKAVLELQKLNAWIARKREVHAHRLSRALVDGSAMIVTEDLSIKGMAKNHRLARSIADAGWGRLLRQIGYKADWDGVIHIKAGKFEPSTQTCSGCGARKTGADKLTLSMRTYRCDGCGLEIDRDLNAATNLRRIGLETLRSGGPIIIEDYDVGQALPELGAATLPTPVEIPLPGQGRSDSGRYGSTNRESSSTNHE